MSVEAGGPSHAVEEFLYRIHLGFPKEFAGLNKIFYSDRTRQWLGSRLSVGNAGLSGRIQNPEFVAKLMDSVVKTLSHPFAFGKDGTSAAVRDVCGLDTS